MGPGKEELASGERNSMTRYENPLRYLIWFPSSVCVFYSSSAINVSWLVVVVDISFSVS